LAISRRPNNLLKLKFRSALSSVIHRILVIRGVPASFGICGWIAFFSQHFIVTPHWKQKLARAAMMPSMVGDNQRQQRRY
jgi:tRNA G37 N-methylase Trm5